MNWEYHSLCLAVEHICSHLSRWPVLIWSLWNRQNNWYLRSTKLLNVQESWNIQRLIYEVPGVCAVLFCEVWRPAFRGGYIAAFYAPAFHSLSHFLERNLFLLLVETFRYVFLLNSLSCFFFQRVLPCFNVAYIARLRLHWCFIS